MKMIIICNNTPISLICQRFFVEGGLLFHTDVTKAGYDENQWTDEAEIWYNKRSKAAFIAEEAL